MHRLKFKDNLIILTLAMGMFLWSFSSGIVNISLPTISQFLDINTSLASLIMIIYLITLTSFLLIFGRIGAIMGLRNVYLFGVFLFSIGSYFCAISLDLYQILAYRIIVGISSAMIISTVPAIITDIFPNSSRGRIFGYISLTTTLGVSMGYGIGGFIVDNFSWNYVFLAVVPIGLITGLLAYKVLPILKNDSRNKSFDFIGSILIFFGILTFILPFNASIIGNNLFIKITTFIISIIALITFFKWESQQEQPLLDLSILKNKFITFSILAAFMATLVLTGTIFLLPFYLELIMGYPSDFAGIIILIPSLILIFIGPLSGYISDRLGTRMPIIISTIALVIATFLLYSLNSTIGLLFILITICMRSLSESMFTPANNKLVLSHSPEGKAESVSSILNTARYLGLVMGIVVFNALFNFTINNDITELTGTIANNAVQFSAPSGILLHGFQSAFLIGIVMSILVLLFSFFSRENKEDDNSISIDYLKKN
ncbi:MAG: MFS transporter [Methanobacterium sp.]